MTVVRTLARLPAALLAAVALTCAAEPFGARLGAERIVLDAPPGFADTQDLASPRLQDLAATLTPASNRILLFALSDADVRRFTQGDQVEANRYMIVVTPKGLERERVSGAQFGAHVSDALSGLGKPEMPADLVKFLESRPIGRANLLEELKKEPTAVSVLQATRLPPLPAATLWDEKKAQYLLFTTSLVLLRGKVLRFDVFTTSPLDLDWLKVTTQRWMDELIRLNR